MIASWALRSLAAETILKALVICCMFFTERIRFRISRKDAIWAADPTSGSQVGQSPRAARAMRILTGMRTGKGKKEEAKTREITGVDASAAEADIGSAGNGVDPFDGDLE